MPDSNESVVFKVEIDDSSVEKGMSDAKKKVTKAANETADAQKKAQNSVSENAEANNNKTVDSSEKADKKVRQSADDTAEARKKAQNDTARNAEETDKKIVDSAEKTHKSVTDTASREGDRLVKKHEEDTEKLKKHQSDYEEKAKKTAENVKKFYVAAGAAIVAETTAAIVAAANYQSSYAKVFTLTADGTDEGAYANSIKQAAKNTGVKVTDMSESVYSAISASVDQDSAVDFTENAVKLAKGGFTETATAVDVLTTAINAYGLAADDASHISDVLITTQNLGKTTVDELAHSMGQTIPIANSAGVAIEELSTMYAVMTKNGVATAESGTQIKAMLNELNASGTNVDKTLREITGKSFAELKSEGQTTADVLNTLAGYAESSGQKLSDLFGSVEAGAAALTLVKDGGTDFSNILNQMQTSAGAAETAYEKMTNTLEAKADKLLNKITIMFAEAGEEMLPLVDELINYVDENADEIEDIIKGIGEMMKNVITIAGDVLKVLWEHKEAVAAVAAAFIAYKTAVAISAVIDKFKTATEGATIAQKLLNVAMSANPAMLIVSGLAALTVGLATFAANMSTASERVEELNEKIRGLSDSAKTAVDEQQHLADVTAEYKHINETVTDAAEKKEKLSELQKTLNDLYGSEKSGIDLVNGSYEEQIGLLSELNEKEKAHRINEVESKLTEAREAVGKMEGQQLTFSLDLDPNTDMKLAEEINKVLNGNNSTIMNAVTGKKQKSIVLFGEGGLYNLTSTGDINDQIETLEKLEDIIFATDEANGRFAEQYEVIGNWAKALREARDNTTELESALDELTNTTGQCSIESEVLGKSLAQLADCSSDTEQQLDEIAKSTKSLISEYSSLYDTLETLKSGEAVNYDQIQDLIDIYPELADKISLTENGYIAEMDALDLLNIALDNSVDERIKAEKAMTQAAIEGARERIIAANSEIAVLYQHGEIAKAQAAEAKLRKASKELDEAQARMKSLDTVADYIKIGTGKKSGSSSSGSSTGGSSGSNSGSGTAVSTSGKGGDPDNEKKYDEEYATLKYRHDMGEIDDETFYKGINDLKDDYLEENSPKWRSANVSIHQYEESLKKNEEDTGSKNTASVSGSGKTVISIDSYIPGVWDTEEERAEKLRKSAELGIGDYRSSIRSIQTDAATVGSTVASTAPVSSTTAETTLTDVVSAIKDMQSADEHKKISFEVELKARDLTIGKVAVADINDMTRASGKTPLIIK